MDLAVLERIAAALPSAQAPAEQVRAIRDAERDFVGGAAAPLATAEVATTAAAPAASFVMNALEGLAQFLQNRARAEIQQFVIDRIRTEVCGQRSVRTFIPATCAFLGRGDDFFVPSFGTAFIASVNDDALHLPAHMGDYIDEHRAVFPGTGGLVLRTGIALVSSLGERVDLTSQATEMLRAVDRWECSADVPCMQWKSGMHFALFALQGVSRFTHESTVEQRTALFNALAALSTAHGFSLTRPQFDTLVAHADRVRGMVAQYRDAQTSTAREALVEPITGEVVAVVNESLDLCDSAGRLPRLPGSVSGLFGAVARRAVGDVIAGASRVALDLLHTAQRAHTTNIPDIAMAIPPDALRILAFAADLGAARTSEQVSAAIDAFAAPVGSWRVKARQSFTLSLGGAFGISAGREWVHSVRYGTTLVHATEGAFGAIFAPVGLDISFGTGPLHFGLLLPIVDVGALLPMSETRDTARSLNPLSFLAPGAMFRVGFTGAPIIIGAGVSYHPYAYATAPVSGGSSISNPSITISGFVAVDIPIFTFTSVH